MWFPKQSPKIDPARYKNNTRVIYVDNEGNEHNATVLESFYASLMTGYKYKIELDEPLNGHKNYVVKEHKLSVPAKKTTKKAKEESAE